MHSLDLRSRVKEAFFIVEPRHDQLAAIAQLLDTGELKTFINNVVPLEGAPEAYSGAARKKDKHGKLVIAVAA
jgi:NADPH:quinone reductase-like Zn-dependent oxidoreductase